MYDEYIGNNNKSMNFINSWIYMIKYYLYDKILYLLILLKILWKREGFVGFL
jgi:hypothetical protein